MQIFRAALPIIPLTFAAASVDSLKKYKATCSLFKTIREDLYNAEIPDTSSSILKQDYSLALSEQSSALESSFKLRHVALGLIGAIILKTFTSVNISNTQTFVFSGIAFAIHAGLTAQSKSFIERAKLINDLQSRITYKASDYHEKESATISCLAQNASIRLQLPYSIEQKDHFKTFKECLLQKQITPASVKKAFNKHLKFDVKDLSGNITYLHMEITPRPQQQL